MRTAWARRSPLPEAFAHAGSRLVYSTGIVVLGALAFVLLVAFGGVTDHLIPLFAVGAFTAFTLSQAGMVAHWKRERGPGSRWRLAMNLAGAIATGAALLVIAAAKFRHGAWLMIVAAPALVILFHRTRAHYERVRRAIEKEGPVVFEDERPPIVVVPVRRLDRVARKAIRFALSMSPDVHAVQVEAGEHRCDDLAARWPELVESPARAAGYEPPRLVHLHSRFREVVHPIAAYASRLARDGGGRCVAVLVPELVERRWYHYLLHSHTATALKLQLLFRGDPHVVIVDAPWHLRESRRRSRASEAARPRAVARRPAPEPAR